VESVQCTMGVQQEITESLSDDEHALPSQGQPESETDGLDEESDDEEADGTDAAAASARRKAKRRVSLTAMIKIADNLDPTSINQPNAADPVSRWVFHEGGSEADDFSEVGEQNRGLADAEGGMINRRKMKQVQNILQQNAVYVNQQQHGQSERPTVGHELEEFLMHMQSHKEKVASNVAQYKTGLVIDHLRKLIKNRDAPREANLALLKKLEDIEAEQVADIKRIKEEKIRRQKDVGILQNREQKLQRICSSIVVAMRIVTNIHNADPCTMIKAFPLLATLAEQDAAVMALIDAGIYKSISQLLILYRKVPEVQVHGCLLLSVLMGGGTEQMRKPVGNKYLQRILVVARQTLPMILSAMSVHPEHVGVQRAGTQALWAMARGQQMVSAMMADKDMLIVRRLLSNLDMEEEEELVQMSIATLLSLANCPYPATFNECIMQQDGYTKIRTALERHPSPRILQYGDFAAMLSCVDDKVTLRKKVPRVTVEVEGRQTYTLSMVRRLFRPCCGSGRCTKSKSES